MSKTKRCVEDLGLTTPSKLRRSNVIAQSTLRGGHVYCVREKAIRSFFFSVFFFFFSFFWEREREREQEWQRNNSIFRTCDQSCGLCEHYLKCQNNHQHDCGHSRKEEEWTSRASCNRFHHHVCKWSRCWMNELPFRERNKHDHLSWYSWR